MAKHPLAPDDILLEYDPWGNLRAYAVFGQWTILTVTWDRFYRPFGLSMMCLGKAYKEEWLTTGKEPRNVRYGDYVLARTEEEK